MIILFVNSFFMWFDLITLAGWLYLHIYIYIYYAVFSALLQQEEWKYFIHKFLCSLAKLCLLTTGKFHESIKSVVASTIQYLTQKSLIQTGYTDFEVHYPSTWASLEAQVKKSACQAGDTGSIPVLGRSLGGGNSNPLQYSCLENSTNRGPQWAVVHRVAKSRTWHSD